MDTTESEAQAEFSHQVAHQPVLRDLVNQVAYQSGVEAPETKTYGTGLEPLAIWACYALFRWSKMILDARQRQLELDAALQQTNLINQLIAEGWPRQHAEKLVPALLEGIKARQADPTFKVAMDKAIALLGVSH